jgi:peptidoglycan/xylan/chitin deacetylase (PgdA/CDA1 family)
LAFTIALLAAGAAPPPASYRVFVRMERQTPLGYPIPGYRDTDDFTRYGEIWRVRTDRKVIALTFDDGPFPFYTSLLLHVLERSQVKATFFLVGKNVQEFPELTKDIADSGNEIANHTFNHVSLPKLSGVQIRQQIADASVILERYATGPVTLFRPPHGRYDRRVVVTAQKLGLHTVFWTDSPDDTKNISPALEIRRVIKQATPGGIILLHSGQFKTVVALPVIIDQLRKRGYSFETVGQMLTDDPR